MRYDVLKTVTTQNRRFQPGCVVSDEDLAEGPISLERWLQLGYIAPIGSAHGVRMSLGAAEEDVTADE